MSPVVKQGIIQLIYSTFLHNSEAIALFTGIALALFLLFRKPKRVYLFFLIGFVCLLVRLEYLKHIVDPLEQQTVGVVVTEEGHFRTKRWIDLFLNDLLPLAMYLAGWGGVFLGLFSVGKKNKVVKKNK